MVSFLTLHPCLTGPLCAAPCPVLTGTICAFRDEWRRRGLKAGCGPRRAPGLPPGVSTSRSVRSWRPQVGERALGSSCRCVCRRPLPSAWPTAAPAGPTPVGCIGGGRWELCSFRRRGTLGRDSRHWGGPVLPLMGQLVLDRAGGIAHATGLFVHDSDNLQGILYWAGRPAQNCCLVLLINNHDGVDDPATASPCSCYMHGIPRQPSATCASSPRRAVGWPSYLAGDVRQK